jgi:hypothetical protein
MGVNQDRIFHVEVWPLGGNLSSAMRLRHAGFCEIKKLFVTMAQCADSSLSLNVSNLRNAFAYASLPSIRFSAVWVLT